MSGFLHSLKNIAGKPTSLDTRMRFSVTPFPGDSGFAQWHDAMTMCARLPEGIPQEFRRRLWLTLAEQHLARRNVPWSQVERTCFNEWSNPDDEELGDQIVKDLHRTGCSLFCGEDAEDNQAMLKRVLLAYARWNKAVGYCQGFNMLAAIILEVMDRHENDALKVMIYLIEGVLPESYFANNLRGLSVDMAVFRDLLKLRLPTLSKHLEYLQSDCVDQITGAIYEPPLTNVFTMQWFLTLFSNCLPRETVMRIWDLTFLQGNEVLLRTALAIWHRLAERILKVRSADEFYTAMGELTRELLTIGLLDSNKLIQKVVAMAPFPFPGLAELRDKYTYNITPWTESVSSVAKKGLRLFYQEDELEQDDTDQDAHKIAMATAFGFTGILKKKHDSVKGEHISKPPSQVGGAIQQGGIQPSVKTGNENFMTGRPNLDISALKKQYTRLRERQRQAHIILTASQVRPDGSKRERSFSSVGLGSFPDKKDFASRAPITMNHLLRGKKALTSKTKKVVKQGLIPTIRPKKKAERKLSDVTGMKPPPSTDKEAFPPVIPKQPLPLNKTNQQVRQSTESVSTNPESVESPSVETLHWKDTPQRMRRMSLPSGVKLMEGIVPTDLPVILADGEEEEDDGNSSTSTELCDEDAVEDDDDMLPDTDETPRPSTSSPIFEISCNTSELISPSKDKSGKELFRKRSASFDNDEIISPIKSRIDQPKKLLESPKQDSQCKLLKSIPLSPTTDIPLDLETRLKCFASTDDFVAPNDILIEYKLPNQQGNDDSCAFSVRFSCSAADSLSECDDNKSILSFMTMPECDIPEPLPEHYLPEFQHVEDPSNWPDFYMSSSSSSSINSPMGMIFQGKNEDDSIILNTQRCNKGISNEAYESSDVTSSLCSPEYESTDMSSKVERSESEETSYQRKPVKRDNSHRYINRRRQVRQKRNARVHARTIKYDSSLVSEIEEYQVVMPNTYNYEPYDSSTYLTKEMQDELREEIDQSIQRLDYLDKINQAASEAYKRIMLDSTFVSKTLTSLNRDKTLATSRIKQGQMDSNKINDRVIPNSSDSESQNKEIENSLNVNDGEITRRNNIKNETDNVQVTKLPIEISNQNSSRRTSLINDKIIITTDINTEHLSNVSNETIIKQENMKETTEINESIVLSVDSHVPHEQAGIIINKAKVIETSVTSKPDLQPQLMEQITCLDKPLETTFSKEVTENKTLINDKSKDIIEIQPKSSSDTLEKVGDAENQIIIQKLINEKLPLTTTINNQEISDENQMILQKSVNETLSLTTAISNQEVVDENQIQSLFKENNDGMSRLKQNSEYNDETSDLFMNINEEVVCDDYISFKKKKKKKKKK